MIAGNLMLSTFNEQRSRGIHVDWFTWQIAWLEARAATIEETASECESLEKLALEDMALENDERFGVYAKKYRLCARRIRDLSRD